MYWRRNVPFWQGRCRYHLLAGSTKLAIYIFLWQCIRFGGVSSILVVGDHQSDSKISHFWCFIGPDRAVSTDWQRNRQQRSVALIALSAEVTAA